MIVSCTTFCQACPLTIMAIDRDHPPDPTHLQKLRPATRERGQLSARSDGSSRSMSPGRCVVDGWDKRGKVRFRATMSELCEPNECPGSGRERPKPILN